LSQDWQQIQSVRNKGGAGFPAGPLERIRRQQAAQTEEENMEEMEEESLMPPLPPPRVCKRSIDPRMPEW